MIVVPYIGTWIETEAEAKSILVTMVVPYIGTWIETIEMKQNGAIGLSYLI